MGLIVCGFSYRGEAPGGGAAAAAPEGGALVGPPVPQGGGQW
jgi:hypothetical protein